MNSTRPNILPIIVKNWALSALMGSTLSGLYVTFVTEGFHSFGYIEYYRDMLGTLMFVILYCAVLSSIASLPALVVTFFSSLGIQRLDLKKHQVKFLMALLLTILIGASVSYTLKGDGHTLMGIGIYTFSAVFFFVNDDKL